MSMWFLFNGIWTRYQQKALRPKLFHWDGTQLQSAGKGLP